MRPRTCEPVLGAHSTPNSKCVPVHSLADEGRPESSPGVFSASHPPTHTRKGKC